MCVLGRGGLTSIARLSSKTTFAFALPGRLVTLSSVGTFNELVRFIIFDSWHMPCNSHRAFHCSHEVIKHHSPCTKYI
jgi:hypothetical protein